MRDFTPSLRNDLAQVVLDRARADEQLRGDLAVRVSLRHEARDLRLLRRQLTQGVDGAFASVLAGRLQLDARALGERLHAEVGEEAVGRPQLPACINASALTSQPFAVEEVSTSEIDGHPSSTESVDRLDVELLGSLIVREERLRARRDPEGPVRPAHPGHLRETRASIRGQLGCSGSDRSLDQLDHPPVRGAEVVRILSDPKRRRASLVVAAEAVVEHRLSPVEHRESDSLTSPRRVLTAFVDQRDRLGLAAA